MHSRTIERTALALTVGAMSIAALAGCAAGGPAADRELSCTNTVVDEDAPQVSVWAWYPSFGDVVDTYNASHDDV